MVSNEAVFFRQRLCGIIADILYKWMSNAVGLGNIASVHQEAPVDEYLTVFRDRRLRIIASKAFRASQREPLLMLRLCWVSFVMGLTASAVACHRIIVNFSETYIGPMSFAEKRFAVTAWFHHRIFAGWLILLQVEWCGSWSTSVKKTDPSSCHFWLQVFAKVYGVD